MLKDILKKISELAIKSGDTKYSNKQIESEWLGNPPAKINGIESAEKKTCHKISSRLCRLPFNNQWIFSNK